MDIAAVLAATLAADANTRQAATQQLETASIQNFAAYATLLSAELVNDHSQPHIRNAAGLALKNAFTSKDETRQAEVTARWLNVPDEYKIKVKTDSLRALSSSAARVGAVAAQVVAAIAAIELPNDQWPDLITNLLAGVSSGDLNTRVAALQCIGFICETISPEILKVRSNEILTAVVQGARRDEPSPEVQLAAMKALYNCLEFIKENFDREGERNYIMQVVCEATQNPAVLVQVAAFETLVRIMSLYYDKMSYYMERALFGLTVLGMNHPDERVALQAVEFWSTVCEEEIDLAIEAADAQEFGDQPERESKYFAKVALPEIIPVILRLLMRQEEDAEEDEWNISMAAGTCLTLLSQAVGDSIVSFVIPFIESNIKSPDWHHREAAVMTFGSILDGPDPQLLAPLVTQAIGLLIEMMRDENTHVKDTTAWTLGRICDILVTTINPETHLGPLVQALVAGLEDSPRIITNASWALMTLSDQINDGMEDVPTGHLSPYYEGIVAALMRVTESNSNEAHSRTAAYEALASYVTHAPKDVLNVVRQVVMSILARMEALLGMTNQLLGVDDRNNWNELQGNFCSIISCVTRKLGREIQPLADKIMTLVLQLIQVAGKQSTVLEDAFLVVGNMASALEQGFHPYLQAFLPFLAPALKAHEDPQLCSVAVGLIGDVCRALGELSAAYCSMFMTALYENLTSPVLDKSVKVSVVACFGDIAMAIGPAFEPYLNGTTVVLRQAGEQKVDPKDYETFDYYSQLREAILEAYTGIVTGLKTTDKKTLLLEHTLSIFGFIQLVYDDDHSEGVLKQCAGLIGDLAETFPSGQLKDLLLQDWVASLVKTKTRNPDLKKTLRWAREAS
ncbi:Importin subunit beta-1 {ECO:0000250/UniProtKB:Q06142} AltName: Full=Importin-95 {ECO:0000250/UniProtKB:Q06142}; AltName: Full=Karyopherin subunit beta-1 {ECO:0000250/UniProtKB:Q06142}; AltName: Full=Karyopherin-95 {ECO:0000250/UniProtKB:Q06142} [Serendipita indica DSM 11827]|uniref:Importin-95 n=1 Tax=Serendipita indica (strain DSM 11827) TaxID=1109443 RepID=G4T568_SERID|nr:Importin subunit beta-1 {ECO:0000250/UniProtKB:Q06142} AltName: Full=Importin-95 {ECO:0000250/UniProtKB:Q06142}; AltName: Full=Karyopherin subunit beta-1 {ECO:0000250/UniProtKB:Q06142}; AltName: Full=Karyopherin-95 {ECO:0000250/UniProtKB:Q06142} [Serendipita indica DSM 11827]CCA66481.1 probable karyopherin beta-1 subunit (importin 95) [Serendipita indica DSM 11827]